MTLSPDAMKLRVYRGSLAAAAERLQGMGKGGVLGHLVATLVATEPTAGGPWRPDGKGCGMTPVALSTETAGAAPRRLDGEGLGIAAHCCLGQLSGFCCLEIDGAGQAPVGPSGVRAVIFDFANIHPCNDAVACKENCAALVEASTERHLIQCCW